METDKRRGLLRQIASRSMQKRYLNTFHKVKQDKHMKFFNVLGSVSLTIELDDRSVTCEATPLQVTVLDALSRGGQSRSIPPDRIVSYRAHSLMSN